MSETSVIQRPWLLTGAQAGRNPSLDLKFLAAPLDPRITFTRASTATYFDSSGVMQTAAMNLWLQSADAANVTWQKAGITAVAPVVTGNQTAAPDGTVTAARAVYPAVSGAGSASLLFQTITATVNPYTFSVYLRGSVGGEQLYLAFGFSATTYYRQSVTLTTGWQRFSVVAPALTAAGWNITIGTDLRDAGQAATMAQTIFVWGAQVELGSAATTYIPTTTAASGAPRFDYDPATHALRGLLIEEQRTNLITQSADLSNVAWNSFQATVVANVGIAPDGTTTAAQITSTGAPGGRYSAFAAQTLGAAYTSTCFAKWVSGPTTLRLVVAGQSVFGGVGGDRNVDFNGQTGAFVSKHADVTGYTITQLTNGWWRVSGTYTPTGSSSTGIALYGGASGTVFQGWGGQTEAGAFPTSYIPTTAAAVTRAVDYVVMPTAPWLNATVGSVATSLTNPSVPATGTNNIGVFTMDDGAHTRANNIDTMLFGNAATFVVPFTTVFVASSQTGQQGYSTNTDLTGRTINKHACAWGNAAIAQSFDGGAVQSIALTGVPAGLNTLTIGAGYGGVGLLNGCIQRLRYWPRVLSNAELQQVTR